MLTSRFHPVRSVVWVLLIVGFFFGGLHLAEQMTLVIDPNEYDGEILTLLEQALQRPSSQTIVLVIFIVNAFAAVFSMLGVPDGQQPGIRPYSPHPSSLPNRYQLLCTYRI